MTTYRPASLLKHDLFFAALAKYGVATRAMQDADLDPKVVYDNRKNDPEFAERWRQALEAFADSLEDAARQRAVTGLRKPVIHQGGLTYLYQLGPDGRPLKGEDGNYLLDLDEEGKPKFLYTREYSDSLLSLMLKAKRKREYGDASKIELTGADGGALKVEESPTAIARSIAFALALGLRAKEQAVPSADDGSDLA